MKYVIKDRLFSSISFTGVYKSLRQIHTNKAIVLTYHGVVPTLPNHGSEYEYRNFVTCSQFEQHIRFMLRHYRPLSVVDFYDPKRDISSGFLITFDDGFKNNLQYAVPILNKYGLRGCFFITTGLINTRGYLWTEEVTRLINKTTQKELVLNWDNGKIVPLESQSDREKASMLIRKKLKLLSVEERCQIIEALHESLSDVTDEMDQQEEDRYLFMTWDDVREMVAQGQDIGGHTHTHAMLSTLTEEQSWEELRLSKQLLEENTGIPCRSMSYPNGQLENFSEVHFRQLRELGYKCAFTQIPLFNTAETELYALRRVNVSLNMPISLLEATLCGFVKA